VNRPCQQLFTRSGAAFNENRYICRRDAAKDLEDAGYRRVGAEDAIELEIAVVGPGGPRPCAGDLSGGLGDEGAKLVYIDRLDKIIISATFDGLLARLNGGISRN